MKSHNLLFLLLVLALLSSCNSEKVEQLERQIVQKDEQINQLKDQLEHLQGTNASLLDRMSDLSLISQQGAENISKSLENISAQYSFIEDLTQKVHSKDSLNEILSMNLKRSLNDFDDDDIQIEVQGSIVHVSISDQMLFETGSAKVSSEANDVLDKLATIINDHSELEVMVQGHTDDVPYTGNCMKDNWDLSVSRATSIVRILEDEFYVNPERMTAAGRGMHFPKYDNESSEGRSQNRRTEIIMTPQLDQFFALLESPVLKN